MNPKFLSDDELVSAFSAAKKSQLKDARMVSWSSNGTSVSKQLLTRTELNAMVNALAREIRFRIAEGKIEQSQFPYLSALARPRGEAPAAFVN